MSKDEYLVKVSYTADFLRSLKRLKKDQPNIKQDLNPVIEDLRNGQVLGDRIPGVGKPVYKVRVKNSDKKLGKSYGYRLIYYLIDSGLVSLLTIYSKVDTKNIKPKEIIDLLYVSSDDISDLINKLYPENISE